jgi:hypothetical protein
MNRDFWYDVMRSGAILGIVMMLSRIFEHYVLFYSSIELTTMSVLYFGEAILSCVVFIWLLLRFSRRRAAACDPQVGFSYGMGLSYILLISMFAGVIVGVGDTIFTSIMGYDAYVEGVMWRINDLKQLYLNMGVSTSELGIFDEFAHAMRTSTQPSMLSSVFTAFNNYILFGALPGFIIAGVVSRKPEYHEMEF